MITLEQAEWLLSKYSTAIIRNDDSCKTAVMCINNRYFRMSIVYSYNTIVFTDPKTDKQIVKKLSK